MLGRLQPWTTTTLTAPPPQAGTPAFGDEQQVQQVLDRYLNDDRGQRFQMGAFAGTCGALACGGASVVSWLGNSLPLLAGSHGIAAGTVLGGVAGLVAGLYACRRFNENRDRFMSAYLLCSIGGFGALIAGAAAQSVGLGGGLIASLGVGLITCVAGGAVRAGQSARAQRDMNKLEKDLDRAIDFEGMVLRNAKAAEKASQPAGQVKVEDDFVIVGGIKVPKGAKQ